MPVSLNREALGLPPYGSFGIFDKASKTTVGFIKTAAGSVSLKAGTTVDVAGILLRFLADTPVIMPALSAGVDYAIYVCTDGSVRADASFTAPAGYTTLNSRKIGGFHYGLVAPGTTVAVGAFNTAGAVTNGGMIWTQADVDAIAGINLYSLWDLKFRPACDPRGMVYQGGGFWVDIYLCSTDVDANGSSKAGTDVASGTVLPKVPAAFGGNGVLTYTALNWWTAVELAASVGKGLLSESEFVQAAFGVTEAISLGGAASTIPSTLRQPGYTSKTGCEQMTGHHYIWGRDSNMNYDTSTYSWKAVTNGRGSLYSEGTYGITRVVLGGSRYGSLSGSRSSNWGYQPWASHWNIGLRARGDHLVLGF